MNHVKFNQIRVQLISGRRLQMYNKFIKCFGILSDSAFIVGRQKTLD